MEDHLPGSSLGETFTAMLREQFERLRRGDRFWYERVLCKDLISAVKATTLADIIERNTGFSLRFFRLKFITTSVVDFKSDLI